MGADTPAEGGGTKNVIKDEKTANHRRQHGNNNACRNKQFARNEKFLGADLNLQGHVFEVKRSRAEQVVNFEKIDEMI